MGASEIRSHKRCARVEIDAQILPAVIRAGALMHHLLDCAQKLLPVMDERREMLRWLQVIQRNIGLKSRYEFIEINAKRIHQSFKRDEPRIPVAVSGIGNIAAGNPGNESSL